jgi:diguanylate cyclase (GGDEF)-like protein
MDKTLLIKLVRQLDTGGIERVRENSIYASAQPVRQFNQLLQEAKSLYPNRPDIVALEPCELERYTEHAPFLDTIRRFRAALELDAGRAKDQKFSILDAPSLLRTDYELPCGLLGRALIYLDIDDFKAQNNRFTERVVDRTLLPEFQRLVLEAMEMFGYAYAEGGDEIVLHLPNASVEIGIALAHAVREVIAEHTFDVDGTNVRLTASFGVAGGRDDSGDRLAGFANKAKRHAKACGKNCVAVWQDGDAIFCEPRTVATSDGTAG